MEARQMPGDAELEQTLIGCLLLDDKQIDEVATIINANDMYSNKAKKLMQVISSMHLENKTVDMPNVASCCKDKNLNIDATYITEAVNKVASPKESRSYAKKIKKYSKHRRLINLSNKVQEKSFDADADIDEIINIAEQQIYDLGLSSGKQGMIYDLQDSGVMIDYINKLEELYKQDGIAGMSTGITDLDNMTGGFEKRGGYTIIAGRPSQGKTMLALNMADYMAQNEGAGAFFSSEMKLQKILNRIIAKRCRINGLRLKAGNLKDSEWEKVTKESQEIVENLPLTIIDNKIKKINEIRSIARRINRKKDLEFIFIDYLQLLQGFDNAGSNNSRVEKLSRTLNNMADQLDCHVIALAQLSRSCENRNDKRPIMSDLRDSGSIEQDADNIIMVYRDEYYNPESDKKNIMELLVRKVRDGEVGVVEAAANLEFQMVKDLSRRGM